MKKCLRSYLNRGLSLSEMASLLEQPIDKLIHLLEAEDIDPVYIKYLELYMECGLKTFPSANPSSHQRKFLSKESFYSHIKNTFNKKIDSINVLLLFIDIDNFKLINDNWGHVRGDEVLDQFKSSIEKVIRKGDVYTRFGGDEFLIGAFVDSLEQSENIEQRVIQKISRIASHGLIVSSSIGACFAQIHKTRWMYDLKEAISKADRAMYDVKRRRKAYLPTHPIQFARRS